MSDLDDALDTVAHVAAELVPQLTERLRRHDLGEIEVSRGDMRLKVASSSGASTAEAGSAPAPDEVALADAPPPGPEIGIGVTSPAVGFFVYADGLGPGLAVGKGDALGHVEVLGVRHDVRAPRGGVVRHLVAESGEAVEYGQTVVELEAAEGPR